MKCDCKDCLERIDRLESHVIILSIIVAGLMFFIVVQL
jgi:hypothetical protein